MCFCNMLSLPVTHRPGYCSWIIDNRDAVKWLLIKSSILIVYHCLPTRAGSCAASITELLHRPKVSHTNIQTLQWGAANWPAAQRRGALIPHLTRVVGCWMCHRRGREGNIKPRWIHLRHVEGSSSHHRPLPVQKKKETEVCSSWEEEFLQCHGNCQCERTHTTNGPWTEAITGATCVLAHSGDVEFTHRVALVSPTWCEEGCVSCSDGSESRDYWSPKEAGVNVSSGLKG